MENSIGLKGLRGYSNRLDKCYIGIKHVFSCINICQVPRKLFEQETDRPGGQISSVGPGKC